MKNIKLFRLAVCFAILASLFSNPVSVHACSCAPLGTPIVSFNESDAIFSGRVVEIKDTRNIIYNFLIWTVRKFEISVIDYSRYLESFSGIEVTFSTTNSWKLVNTSSVKNPNRIWGC